MSPKLIAKLSLASIGVVCIGILFTASAALASSERDPALSAAGFADRGFESG